MNISGFKAARFLSNFVQTIDYPHLLHTISLHFFFLLHFSLVTFASLLFTNRTNIENVENAPEILLIEMTALQIRGYIEAVLCDMIKKGLVITAALRIDQ